MKVHHIAITVVDIEISKRFYIDLFGFAFVREFDKPAAGAKFCYLEKDGFQLELWHFGKLVDSDDNLLELSLLGMRHLAFSVENVEKTVADLRSKGADFENPIRGSSGKMYSLGKDPSGVAIEIIEE